MSVLGMLSFCIEKNGMSGTLMSGTGKTIASGTTLTSLGRMWRGMTARRQQCPILTLTLAPSLALPIAAIAPVARRSFCHRPSCCPSLPSLQLPVTRVACRCRRWSCPVAVIAPVATVAPVALIDSLAPSTPLLAFAAAVTFAVARLHQFMN